MKINAKITGAVVLLVASLAAVATLGGYGYFTHKFRAALTKQNEALLAMASDHLNGEVARYWEILDKIAAAAPESRPMHADQLQLRLDRERLARTFFDGGFEFVDSQGKVIAESPRAPRRAVPCVEYADFVSRTFSSGKRSISPPYYSASFPHHPIVSFALPVKGPDGRVTALLIGRHDLQENGGLTDLARISAGQGSFLFLVDRNRTVILHPKRERIMKRSAPGRLPALDRAIAEEGIHYSEGLSYQGVKASVLARRVANTPWVIGIFSPLKELDAPLRGARTFFIASFLLFLVPATLSLWLLIRRTTAPLLQLTEHVRSLAEKEGEQRLLTLKTGDELESLAGAFNEMVREMDEKHAVLRHNQELYRVISEFTMEFAVGAREDAISYISANCLALTGYSDAEFYADPLLLSRIIHPEDLPLWREFTGAASDDTTTSINVRLINKNGETRWFNHIWHRVPNLTGEGQASFGGSFRDITRKVVLERELERQRQFAESLLENTSMPMFVLDSEHRIIFWNRAAEALTGFSAQQMLGTTDQWKPFYPEKRPTLSDLVLDHDTERVSSYYEKFDAEGVLPGIVRAEGWYANLGGKKRYIVFDAAPVKHGEETVAVVESLYDITERATAEESLRLFSQAVEQSGSSVVITDPAGNIEYVNCKFCEVTGYRREEALGKNPRLLKSDHQPPEVYQQLWQTIVDGGVWHGELHNRRKNGTFFWESATISPIVDAKGKIRHFLAVKEDISQRKEAERTLTKKQAELVLKHEQLANLFRQVEQVKMEWEQTMDCIDDMVIMADPDHRVRRFNRAFADFTEHGSPEVLGADWRFSLGAVGLDIASVEGTSGEIFHQESGRWFTLRIYPYGDRGGSVITMHDLTEIKRVSDELAAAYEELKATHSQLLQQEKMASIGQLAAGVAHEINNPMGFISSNLGSMAKYLDRMENFLGLQGNALKGCADEATAGELAEARKKLRVDYILEDARALLAESREGAERVRTIVQNLKSFSRIDDAKVTMVDVNECLESTINIAWNELKYKATLTRDYGEIPQIKGLPQQLNQVFLNLLVNAAHAIEEKGEITVATRQEGDQVLITVRDSGCGIPEEIRHRIFEPFFTTKKVGQGTGLGLSISYDIIKKHQGRIEVESNPGVGTTFTVRLPVGEA
ncbi:PAS domain S-box protein [Geomonas sp. Red875]|uniref:histidine kinase n=1 Tax=Geomesophilobacter sediminis TaxID=2798584 RepID=A0A8J7M1X7_9BACT|nr:PAS domain S-box protein [Geomesophilobacter sediminis]